MQENQEKSKLQTILAQLTKDQLRFVVALQEHKSKDAAAKALKFKPDTVYHWDVELIEEASRLMALDTAEYALELRRQALAKAMMVKTAGLDSRNEQVRQKAATEIIEWGLGKAAQSVDLTSNGETIGKADETRLEIQRKLARIASAGNAIEIPE